MQSLQGNSWEIMLMNEEGYIYSANPLFSSFTLPKIQRTADDLEKYVTVSIGVATIVPDQTKPKESLIQLADQALYEAKSLGRNRVIVKNDGYLKEV